MSDKTPALEGSVTVYPSLFGGVGEVRVLSLLHGASEPFTAVLSCELAPGGRVGAHLQQEFPELVIGIAGEGEARVNGAAHALDALHAVHLPLGAALEIVNRSEHEPLRYLIVKARGG
jgi:quercetin dioxygenase-like cupin family protein